MRHTIFSALVFGLGLSLFSGCLRYRYVSSDSATPREPNCSLRAVSTMPQGDVQELGFFEKDLRPTNSANELLDHVRAEACAAGADTILLQVDGYGLVVRAVALKTKP